MKWLWCSISAASGRLRALAAVGVIVLLPLWWRSYYTHRFVGVVYSTEAQVNLASANGSVHLHFARYQPGRLKTGFGHSASRVEVGDRPYQWYGRPRFLVHFLGFGAETEDSTFRIGNGRPPFILRVYSRAIFVPYWFLVFLASGPFILHRIRSTRRESYLRSRRCATCGYDLRGSRANCPECNTPVPRRQCDMSAYPESITENG